MEYLNRETRDVPFGWLEALQSLLRQEPQARSEPLRLPPPETTATCPAPSAR
jgi:hypothetical protein